MSFGQGAERIDSDADIDTCWDESPRLLTVTALPVRVFRHGTRRLATDRRLLVTRITSMPYRRKDHFYRRAKSAGYRSRAAYKLLELARRYRLIQPGDHVVDLGAWPGGWLQVAAELVGPRGLVIGVDLVEIEPIGSPVVALVRGDAAEVRTLSEIERRSGGRVDVLLSDLSPKLTGIRATDQARAAALAAAAVEAARALLSPGGRLLLKLFEGPEVDALAADVQRCFGTVKRTRPEATRAGSSELYLVALDYRPESG